MHGAFFFYLELIWFFFPVLKKICEKSRNKTSKFSTIIMQLSIFFRGRRAGRGRDSYILSRIIAKSSSPGPVCFVQNAIHLLYFCLWGQLFCSLTSLEEMDISPIKLLAVPKHRKVPLVKQKCTQEEYIYKRNEHQPCSNPLHEW